MEQKQIDLEKIMFAVEPLHQVKEDIKPLIEKHWEELEWNKSKRIDPDWKGYESCDAMSSLIIFTAREEGLLIGYNVFFLHNSFHYKGLSVANQDLIYISPERRGFGKYFIYWCDERLKELGVKRLYYHVKADKDFGDKILVPMKYKLIDHVYEREF
jgi:hypothetical protein